MCCLPIPFLHAKLITFAILPTEGSAINRQEGGIAAPKLCLKALPLSLPSPLNFFPVSPNKEPVHRLHVYVAYSKLYNGKKRKAEHTLCLKSDIKSIKLQFTKIYEML